MGALPHHTGVPAGKLAPNLLELRSLESEVAFDSVRTHERLGTVRQARDHCDALFAGAGAQYGVERLPPHSTRST